MTPDLTTDEIRKTKKFSKVKADEILMWLKNCPDVYSWVVLDDLELHNDSVYPSVYTLLNGGSLDYGEGKAKMFDAKCPDEGRVTIHGEVIDEVGEKDNATR